MAAEVTGPSLCTAAGRGSPCSEGNGFTMEEIEYESVTGQNMKTDIELAVLPPIDVEDNILYGRVLSAQCRIVAEPVNESAPAICQNVSFKKKVGLKYDEETFSLTKGIHLNTVAGIDHFKHYCNNMVKMESVFDNEIFEDQQRKLESLASEEILLSCASHPQQPSCNVHFLSSILTQHSNNTLLPLDDWTRGGKAHPNVRMIPVLRQLVSPVAGVSNYICYEPWKEGVPNGPVQSPDLPASSDEYCDGFHPPPLSSGDDCAEVKLAVASIMDGNKEQAAVHDPNAYEMNCTLLSSPERLEQANCSQRNDSSSLVFCHLKGSTPRFCVNNPGTREIKTIHVVPQYQGQPNSLQSCAKEVDKAIQLPDISAPLPTLLGRFLPLPGTSNLSFEQEGFPLIGQPTKDPQDTVSLPGCNTSAGLPITLWEKIMSRDNTTLQASSSPVQPYTSVVPFPQIKSEDSGIAPAGLNTHLGCSLMPGNYFPQLHNGALQSHVNNAVFTNVQGPSNITLAGGPVSTWDAKSKKPCNCTKSQCLKLYCDCFANGEFCSNCNCNNCYNNIQHELERFKAIKACLDRNPEAFQPKIGKGKLGDIKPRHNKGCNCKRSGCLKNYCECYEAKIMCSSICKCIGCKNYEESPDRKTLMSMPHYAETGRFPLTCISWEVVEATCACLLAQGEEAEKENYPISLAEQMILEEFGRCLSQILHSEFKTKGLQID